MHHLFTFFSRLFFAFLAAKLLTGLVGLPGLNPLVGLTFLFLGNVYLFDYLDYRSRSSWRRRAPRPLTTPAPAPPTAPGAPPKT